MNRRDFLRRSALLATGAVAADQLELLDRLGWVRRWFAGWSAPQSGIVVTKAEWDALLSETYTARFMALNSGISPLATPFMRNVLYLAGKQWVPVPAIEVVRG